MDDQDREWRDAIISEIRAAFADVTRGADGISWHESVAIDNYEDAEVRAAARLSDTDSHWSELIDDSNWQPFPGLGGFCFVNTEGFRYYLPPTMIRFLNGDQSEWFSGHLLNTIERFTTPEQLQFWTEGQLRAVARFVAFMARHDESEAPEDTTPNIWDDGIRRRWSAYLPPSEDWA